MLGNDSVEAVTLNALPVVEIIGSKVLAVGNNLEEWLRIKPAL